MQQPEVVQLLPNLPLRFRLAGISIYMAHGCDMPCQWQQSVRVACPNSPMLLTGGWGDFFATSDELVLDWTP